MCTIAGSPVVLAKRRLAPLHGEPLAPQRSKQRPPHPPHPPNVRHILDDNPGALRLLVLLLVLVLLLHHLHHDELGGARRNAVPRVRGDERSGILNCSAQPLPTKCLIRALGPARRSGARAQTPHAPRVRAPTEAPGRLGEVAPRRNRAGPRQRAPAETPGANQALRRALRNSALPRWLCQGVLSGRAGPQTAMTLIAAFPRRPT